MLSTLRCRRLVVGCLLLFSMIIIIKKPYNVTYTVIKMKLPFIYNRVFEQTEVNSNVDENDCKKTMKNEEFKEKLRKQVNKSVGIYQGKLETVLSPRIFDTLIKDNTLCKEITSYKDIYSKTFLELLKNMTISALHELSEEVAEKYPYRLNLQEFFQQVHPKPASTMKAINEYTYSYVYNPINICKKRDVYLLVVVKSFVEHFRSRQVLRKTWIKDFKKKVQNNSVVVFSLGYSHRDRYMVEDEHSIHGDIIQGSFIDAYRNNTLKIMMTLDWTTRYCWNARFIMFVDDDLIVNVRSTLNFLASVSKQMEEDLFSGMPVIGGLPERIKKSKWFIDNNTYPYPVFPEYIAGCAMFMSRNVVKRMHAALPFVKYFPFDDVYLGILARKLRIPIHENELLKDVHLLNLKTLTKAIANHGFQNEDFLFETYGKFIENKVLTTSKFN